MCIFNPNKAWLKNDSLKNIGTNKKRMSKMSYSESEPDSNFVINSLSNFDPTFFESKSESDNSESDSS